MGDTTKKSGVDMRDAFDTVKEGAEGFGGALGGAAGMVEKFGKSAIAAGKALGPVGVALAAVTLGVGAAVIGFVSAANGIRDLGESADELRERLRDLHAEDAVSAAAIANVERFGAAARSTEAQFAALKLTLISEARPALESIANSVAVTSRQLITFSERAGESETAVGKLTAGLMRFVDATTFSPGEIFNAFIGGAEDAQIAVNDQAMDMELARRGAELLDLQTKKEAETARDTATASREASAAYRERASASNQAKAAAARFLGIVEDISAAMGSQTDQIDRNADRRIAAIIAENKAIQAGKASDGEKAESAAAAYIAIQELERQRKKDLADLAKSEAEAAQNAKDLADAAINARQEMGRLAGEIGDEMEGAAEATGKAFRKAVTEMIVGMIGDVANFSAEIGGSLADSFGTFSELRGDAIAESVENNERALKQIGNDSKRTNNEIASIEQELAATRDENRRAELEGELSKLQSIEKGQLAAEKVAKKMAKDRKKRLRKEGMDAFKAQKTAARAGVWLDSARSYMGLLSAFAFMGPLAPGAAAAVQVPATYAQLAVINRQEPPKFHDGTDEILATLRSGEAVLNQRAANNIGRDTIDAANKGSPAPAMGAQSVTFAYQGRAVEKVVLDAVRRGGPLTEAVTGSQRAGYSDPYRGR